MIDAGHKGLNRPPGLPESSPGALIAPVGPLGITADPHAGRTEFPQQRSVCSPATLSTIDLVGVVTVISEVVSVTIAQGPLDRALAEAGVI